MAKKLIYTTVETITPYIIDYDIIIPANTKEYFHILSAQANPNTINYTQSAYTYNKTSASVTVEKIKNNGEIASIHTVGPYETYRNSIEKGECIRLKEFKNYEDAIFIEWPKS